MKAFHVSFSEEVNPSNRRVASCGERTTDFFFRNSTRKPSDLVDFPDHNDDMARAISSWVIGPPGFLTKSRDIVGMDCGL